MTSTGLKPRLSKTLRLSTISTGHFHDSPAAAGLRAVRTNSYRTFRFEPSPLQGTERRRNSQNSKI